MSNLVRYEQSFLVPKDRITASLVYMLTPNEINYVGNAALALTDSVLWVATPGRSYDLVPLQNIREAPEIKEFRGFSYPDDNYGKRMYITPQNAWGVVIKYQGLGNFTYSLSFVTFFYPNAALWQGKIQYAIARLEEELFNLYRHGE